MKFYTGLTFRQFLELFNFLGSAVDSLIYWGRERKHVELETTPTKRRSPKCIMTPQNELILTLIRLRLGLLHRQFAYICLISGKPRLFRHHMDQIHACRAYNLIELRF